MVRKKSLYLLLIAAGLIVISACQLLAQVAAPATPTPSPTIALPTQPPTAAPTVTSTPTQEPTPAPTTQQTGSVRGNLGYPAGGAPSLHIVAFLFGTDTYFTIDTGLDQMSYQLDGLQPGKYHVVAYSKGGGSFPEGLAGGYTQAAKCGIMEENCTDHTLVDVTVDAGQLVENVDLIDWLVPMPPMPQPGGPVLGAITGKLSYPSEFIPPTRVVAFRLSDGQAFFVDTQMNEGQYTLPVPAGTYHVMAYAGKGETAPGVPGGYSQMVPCGLSVDCTDHSLIDVVVVQGSVTYGIDPGDFYAPEGTFPPAP